LVDTGLEAGEIDNGRVIGALQDYVAASLVGLAGLDLSAARLGDTRQARVAAGIDATTGFTGRRGAPAGGHCGDRQQGSDSNDTVHASLRRSGATRKRAA
jgi:hypothetical protein